MLNSASIGESGLSIGFCPKRRRRNSVKTLADPCTPDGIIAVKPYFFALGGAMNIATQPAFAVAMDVVEACMAAYNRHDVEAVECYLADDVRWLSVAGASMTTESSGRDSIAEGLREYFAALPSTILNMHSNGSFVSVTEKASWSRDGKRLRQCAQAVYDIDDNRLINVWCFGTQSCAITAESALFSTF